MTGFLWPCRGSNIQVDPDTVRFADPFRKPPYLRGGSVAESFCCVGYLRSYVITLRWHEAVTFPCTNHIPNYRIMPYYNYGLMTLKKSRVLVLNLESLMHKSESSSSHSVLESKSSHESLNLAHESDSSPSPGLEYYNTGGHYCKT